MLKISKRNDAKLDCICGLCDHDCLSKTCLFNKILAAPNPEKAQKKAIIELMNKIAEENTPKNSRAKMTTKKGKK